MKYHEKKKFRPAGSKGQRVERVEQLNAHPLLRREITLVEVDTGLPTLVVALVDPRTLAAYTHVRTLCDTLMGKAQLYEKLNHVLGDLDVNEMAPLLFERNRDGAPQFVVKSFDKGCVARGEDLKGAKSGERPLREAQIHAHLSRCAASDRSSAQANDDDRDRDRDRDAASISFPAFHGLYETPSQFLSFMEYVPGSELFDAVCAGGSVGEPAARELFVQMAQTLAFIHSCGIAHLDLSLENLVAR
jgi:serine/threonine protein kinase